MSKTEIAPTRPTGHARTTVQVARLRLTASPYPGLRRLNCHFHEGVLTVRGRVSTFHERQMAWIALCDVAGVEEFVDHVEVVEQATDAQGDGNPPCFALRRAK
ncbi:MAG TPA: hypothetical protein VMV69_26005 [Pirellulales bacterium]|nr:hypothetical protein [Pirellulales bacterium]